MSTAVPARSPVQRVSVDGWRRRGRHAEVPLVVTGVADDATTAWFAPEALRARYPQVPVAARRWVDGVHRVGTLPLARFLDRFDPCDLYQAPQTPLEAFAGLGDHVDLAALAATPVHSSFLWIAVDHRMPSHYDIADNLVVQMVGRRDSVLQPPESSARHHLRPHIPGMSAVNPRAVDRDAYPDYDLSDCHHAELGVGDALFVPRGWYHDLAGDGVSVAVNAWSGPLLSAPERA